MKKTCVLVVALLLLAACGDSDGGSEAVVEQATATTQTAAPTTAPPPTTAAPTTTTEPQQTIRRDTQIAVAQCLEEMEEIRLDRFLELTDDIQESVDLCEDANLLLDLDGGGVRGETPINGIKVQIAEMNLAALSIKLAILLERGDEPQFDEEVTKIEGLAGSAQMALRDIPVAP